MTAPSEVELSVVIPAFNEADNLSPVVSEALGVFSSASWIGSFELIVVDDGSSDGTAAVAEQLRSFSPNVVVLHHAKNRGFGAALKTGFAASRGRLVSMISADGEVGPDQVVNLIRAMGDADLVLGYRERKVSIYRRLLTLGQNTLLRVLVGFVPKEVLIYVVNGELLRGLPLRSETGLVNLEVQMHCHRTKCRTRSAVARARPRLSGVSKVANARTMWRTYLEMVKLGRSV